MSATSGLPSFDPFGTAALDDHPHAALIRRWFDPTGYVQFHDDLQAAGLQRDDVEAARYHFEWQGYGERRVYAPRMARSFDPAYYLAHDPLGLRGMGRSELLQHWLYRGVFSGRAANATTEAALRARYHVYNPGRVGSFSIVDMLLRAGMTDVVHTHSSYEFSRTYPASAVTYDQLLTLQSAVSLQPRLLFLTGVRDPLSWAVSAVLRGQAVGDVERNLSIAALAQLLARTMPRVIDWFSHGYGRGFDVFDQSFDVDTGLSCYEAGAATIMVYRLDAIERVPGVVARIVDAAIPAIDRVNASQAEAGLRDQVLAAVYVMPRALRERVAASRYVRQFFSAGQRDEIRRDLAV